MQSRQAAKQIQIIDLRVAFIAALRETQAFLVQSSVVYYIE
jgi:hypothetical protein